MLRVENLSVYYGEYRAVNEASFEVAPGELVTFIGANGAGKTSTIRAGISRAYRPMNGSRAASVSYWKVAKFSRN
jgi:branched-chain amino acid transport system ATP-binding protein